MQPKLVCPKCGQPLMPRGPQLYCKKCDRRFTRGIDVSDARMIKEAVRFTLQNKLKLNGE